MDCPHCGQTHWSLIIDSRQHGSQIKRIRSCKKCGKEFVTYEGIVAEITQHNKVMHRHHSVDWASASECPYCQILSENARLRNALKEIADGEIYPQEVARAALYA